MTAAKGFDADLKIEVATIVFADIVESVRLVARDEGGNVARLRALLNDAAHAASSEFDCDVIERRGDGLLLRASTAERAVACAMRLHALAQACNEGMAGDDVLAWRIGIHRGNVLADASALYGRSMNVAARIAALAQPHGTTISSEAREDIVDAVDCRIRDLGECHLKHVDAPVRVYSLAPLSTHPAPEVAPLPHSQELTLATIAVLPLVGPASRDTGWNAADIFVDQLTAALSRSPSLRVIARLSSNAFRGRDIRSDRAADHLRAQYAVGGRFATNGHRLDIELSLLHVASNGVVWECSLSAPASDVLSTEGELVAAASRQVLMALTSTEDRIAHGRPLPKVPTHTLYLSAVSSLHRFSLGEFNRSREMLEALSARAPRNSEPYAWLARWHVFRIVQGWSSNAQDDGARALDFVSRALDADPMSSLALTMAGSVQAGVKRDMDAARSFYDRALASNPNEPLAWLMKGVAHGFLGDATDALRASETSLRLSPLDPLRFYYNSLSSAAAMGAQSFERAAQLAEQAIVANCMHGSAYRTLAIAQVMLGQQKAARDTICKLLAVEPGSTVEQFRARSAVRSSQNEKFALALAEAGLPLSVAHAGSSVEQAG